MNAIKKEFVLKEFIKANSRVPTELELKKELFKLEKQIPDFNKSGALSSFQVSDGVSGVSSVEAENEFRKLAAFDINSISEELLSLISDSQISRSLARNKTKYLLSELNAIEAKIDTVLVASDESDFFTNAEYLLTQRGLTPSSLTDVSLDTASVSCSMLSPCSNVSISVSSELLKAADNRVGQVSGKPLKNVFSFSLDVRFPSKTNVSLVSLSVISSLLLKYELYLSLDGSTYFKSQESQSNDGCSFSFNQELMSIRLIISSEVIPLEETTVLLDSLSISALAKYLEEEEFVDEFSLPQRFSSVYLSSCSLLPSGTDISFFVSMDETAWVPIQEGSSLGISFSDDKDEIVLNPVLNEDDPDSKLGVLNFSIENYSNVSVLRNMKSSEYQNGVKIPGWRRDNGYSCWFYVENQDGITFDFGPNGCKINNRAVSGQVHVEPGMHSFWTAETNWNPLGTHQSVYSLKSEDRLYPYNHRYVIEGYNYPSNFSGEKLYRGVTTVFEILMKRRNFGFDISNDRSSYIAGTNEILIAVDNHDLDWQNEDITVMYETQSGGLNVFVKSVLRTSDTTVTPYLESISLRTI